jgi:MFS family permease
MFSFFNDILCPMFANPIGGAISDHTTLKFGRRRTWIILGSLIGAGCLVGIGISKSYIIVVILWILTQIAFNFVYASFTALIPDQVDEGRRGSILGILGLAMSFSPIIGLVLMTIIGDVPTLLKWSILAVISVGTAVLSCILIKEGKVKFKSPKKEKIVFGEALSRIYPSPRKHPVFTWGWLTRFFISLAYCSSTYNAMMANIIFGEIRQWYVFNVTFMSGYGFFNNWCIFYRVQFMLVHVGAAWCKNHLP